MSYKCDICFESVKSGVSCHKRVTKKRTKHYPERPYAKREWRFEKGKWKKGWTSDPGGIGFEAIIESGCCPQCAMKVDHGEI